MTFLLQFSNHPSDDSEEQNRVRCNNETNEEIKKIVKKLVFLK